MEFDEYQKRALETDRVRAPVTNIATAHLEKISDRFNRKTNLRWYLFDQPYKLKESLPRRFEVEIRQTGNKVPREVQCFYEGKKMGNYLTDNSHLPHGYRFHDVSEHPVEPAPAIPRTLMSTPVLPPAEQPTVYSYETTLAFPQDKLRWTRQIRRPAWSPSAKMC